jgi:hypothetical protein
MCGGIANMRILYKMQFISSRTPFDKLKVTPAFRSDGTFLSSLIPQYKRAGNVELVETSVVG